MEDLIHLFKGFAVRLRDAEVGPHKRQQAKDCEKDVSTDASLLDKRCGNEADDKVPQPTFFVLVSLGFERPSGWRLEKFGTY